MAPIQVTVGYEGLQVRVGYGAKLRWKVLYLWSLSICPYSNFIVIVASYRDNIKTKFGCLEMKASCFNNSKYFISILVT